MIDPFPLVTPLIEPACLTQSTITVVLREIVHNWMEVTYTLAYITGLACFGIGCFVGWSLYERRHPPKKPEPDSYVNDGR